MLIQVSIYYDILFMSQMFAINDIDWSDGRTVFKEVIITSVIMNIFD